MSHVLTFLCRPSPTASGGWWIWSTHLSEFDEQLVVSLGWTVLARDHDDLRERDITLVRQLDERWQFGRPKRLTE